MTEAPEFWWRAEDRRYADYDPWAEYEQPTTSHCKIQLHSYRVLKHTPKGVRLSNGQFVLGEAIRQLAVPTKELALQDLVQRKRRHVRGCEARLAEAKEHLELALKALAKEQISGRS